MKIAIVGTGAMGSVYATLLAAPSPQVVRSGTSARLGV
jgi:ketopantoate reductase